MSLSVLNSVGSLGVNAGGPSRTVPALCLGLSLLPDVYVQLIAGRVAAFGDNIQLTGLNLREIVQPDFLTCGHEMSNILSFDPNFVTTPKLVHDHGQWLPINRASASVSRRLSLPRVVSPRGMLSPWAMRHRRWKKWAAWNLFAKRDIQSAQVIHATSQLEAMELRDLGLSNPIAVIPNGVENPSIEWLASEKKKQVLFLSRLHPKKGVVELVSAWRALRPEGWSLVLAGPDEANMVSQLQLNDSASIQWVGNVEGEDKWRLLSESSLFILPSYSENFAVVVAEALIAGTPVIATHGTPWESLVTEKCGWWVEMTIPSIQTTLEMALDHPAEELRAMGQRGRLFAERAFGWPQIANEMAEVYRWILGQGAKPACII